MQAIEHLEYGETYHVYNVGVQHCVLFRNTCDYERFLSDYERYISVVAKTLAWCLMGNHFHFVITILREEDILPFSELPASNRLKTTTPTTPSVVANPDGGTINEGGIINVGVINVGGVTRLLPGILPLSGGEVNTNLLPLSGGEVNTNLLPLSGGEVNTNLLPLSGGEVNTNLLPLSGSLTADRVAPYLRKPRPSNQLSHLFNSYAQYYNKKYQRRGVLFEKGFRRKLVDDPEYLKNLVDYIHNNPVHHGFLGHPGDYPWSSYTSGRLTTNPIH